ncbi:MAG: hypothetical protein IPG66_13805 [Hydrogenophilales bacterium]|nr:hypothetical protein [Hydrogenophilales bacterium]
MSIGLEDPNGYRVAELREVKVHGLPGIGSYTLVLMLHFMATQPRAASTLRNVSVRLEWGGNEQRMIGVAQPDGQVTQIHQHSTHIPIRFRIPLSAVQIESIENRRNGGNFKLALWFMCDVEQADKSQSKSDRYEFEVRQQDWIDALERMEYRKTMLFELPVPSADAPVGELVAKAQAFLHKGDYDQAVTLCRQAIEKIEGLAGDKSAAGQAVKNIVLPAKTWIRRSACYFCVRH